MSDLESATPPPENKSRLTSFADFLKSITGVITAVAALLAAAATLVGYFVTRNGSEPSQTAAPPAVIDPGAASTSNTTATTSNTTTSAPPPSSAPADSVEIDLDQRVEGKISRVGELDRYSIAFAAPTRVFPDSQSVSGECGSGARLDWSLAPESSDVTVFDDVLYSGYCYDQRLRSLDAGTYVLTVKGYEGATSRYAFTLRSAPEQVRELTIGERAKGALNAPGATDHWRVTVAGPTTVMFDAIPNVGDQCGPGGFLSWELFYEGSETSILRDLFYAGSCYDRENVSFPRAGTYDLVISGEGDKIGPYVFRLVPSG